MRGKHAYSGFRIIFLEITHTKLDYKCLEFQISLFFWMPKEIKKSESNKDREVYGLFDYALKRTIDPSGIETN